MRKTRIRLSAVYMAMVLGFVVIWGRAGQLQIFEGERHRDAARRQRTSRVEVAAMRGAIYDRNGVPLARTREIFHLGIAPNELTNGREAADIDADVELIAATLGLVADELRIELASSRYAYFHGPFSGSEIHVIADIPGVHPERELSRLYPDPDLARALLGRPASNGTTATGIEKTMDSVLIGVPGTAFVIRDHRGNRYESPGSSDAFPRPGNAVYLTIDAQLQEIVESALMEALREYEAIGGDVVVIDPHSGEILALASIDSSGRQRLSPITNPYEPGSTAKLFAAAALLENGLVAPGDTVWGEGGTYEFGGRTISDVHEVEWATLGEVIENSSNIGIVKFTRILERDQQFRMLRGFGFGTPTGLEFPTESKGTLRLPRRWSGFSSASLAMGYEFAVTPLQLSVAYAAIANDGLLLRPTLIRAVRSPGDEVLWEHQPEPVRQVVAPATARVLLEMLKGVVFRGSQAALASYEVAGKTGTTRRIGEGGAYLQGSYNASFASLFPADDPQLVMVVKLEDPRGTYGSQTAAPVTREVLERTLASHTNALDRTRLSRTPGTVRLRGLLESDNPPVLMDLPFEREVRPVVIRAVPEVAGLSIRDAARILHGRGFEVRLLGWGGVLSTDPAPGDSLATGGVVTVYAGPGSE